jgi:hypothetical protein
MTFAFILSLCIALFIAAIQLWFYARNKSKLQVFQSFFVRNGDTQYAVVRHEDETQLDTSIAISGSSLACLLDELNVYIHKNRGTTDFSIIQNKTERQISALYEYATAWLAFPTYIGLMGTFLGVFVGLCFFWWGLTGTGISDEVIGNLISGVLVSMSTSLLGLGLSTHSNYVASKAKKQVDEEKNIFFEFVQNELLPSLGVSMVEALNKLHQTINLFEPAFNRVIERFQKTFDECTQSFGSAFKQNVTVVAEAVTQMGTNMNKINENVHLQEKLLKTLHSNDVQDTLTAFVAAARQFDTVSVAINRYETMCSAIKEQTDALIEQQRSYNESLSIPSQLVTQLNALLNRITTFEDSINNLGTTVAQTQLLGNRTIQTIELQLTAIQNKQQIAARYMDITDSHLEEIFKSQDDAIKQMNTRFEGTLLNYAEQFEKALNSLAEEMKSRRAEIVAQIEEKFSIANIHNEFSQLEKISDIESQLTVLSEQVSDAKMQQIIAATRQSTESVKAALSTISEEIQANAHSGISSDQLEHGLAPLQKLSTIEETLKEVSSKVSPAKTEQALQQTQQELASLRASLENAVNVMKSSTTTQSVPNRTWWPFR